MNLGLYDVLSNFLIIGSVGLNIRPSNDIDVIVHSKDIHVSEDKLNKSNENIYTFQHRGIRIECHLADKNHVLSRILSVEKGFYASKSTLLLLKWGHLPIPSPKWEMDMLDYNVLKEIVSHYDYSPFRPDEYDDLMKRHRRETLARYKADIKAIKLKGRTSKSFFDDNITKFVHHDRIHEWMAVDEFPAYKKMQLPGNEVQCEKDLFDKLTYEQQLNCVIEETRVIACERFLIPKLMSGKVISPIDFRESEVRAAFKQALMKVCTTLTSGWFRDFALNNYLEVMNDSSMNFHLNIKVDELDPQYKNKE